MYTHKQKELRMSKAKITQENKNIKAASSKE